MALIICDCLSYGQHALTHY